MIREFIINGEVYAVFGMVPGLEDNKSGLIKEEMRKKEKHTRERDWKQMARNNYRKK